MIISHNKKFVMLEPWKTASQTMRARLHEHSECESRYPGFFYFNPYLNRVVHQHITRAEFDCLPEAKLGYLTAAFVRNPYDRVNSGFRQLQKDIQEQPSARFSEPWIRDLVRKQLAENFAQLCQAGFEFASTDRGGTSLRGRKKFKLPTPSKSLLDPRGGCQSGRFHRSRRNVRDGFFALSFGSRNSTRRTSELKRS
jgi:hypothetical protein